MYGYFFGMSILWWFFWIVVIAVLFSLLVPVSRNRARTPRETPLEILQRRYAAGELTTGEYEERRKRLLADRPDDRPPHDRPGPPPIQTRPPEAHPPAKTTPPAEHEEHANH